jgi:hypothetical protein
MAVTLDEHLLPLSEVPHLIPRPKGRQVHISTIYRWSTTGLRGVVLETLQTGATRATSREALGRFFAQLTAANQGAGAEGPGPRSSQKTDSVEKIERDLDEQGL